MIKKQKLRWYFKKLRDNLDSLFVKQANYAIYKKLLALSKDYTAIFCYVSFGSEADTKRYIKEMLKLGKIVSVPKIKGTRMEAIQIYSLKDLTKSKLGTLEPTCGTVIKPKQIDLIIAPCIAFNDKNYRLGYGGGFYDRFLKNTNTVKVLAAYSCQKTEEDFEEPHDEKLDLIITEQ